jgi:hypothetical protein
MKRILSIAGAVLVPLVALASVAVAADPVDTNDRVLLAFNSDLTLPAGEQADFILVARGNATIAGDVETLVILEGSATLTGATADTIVAARSDVTLGPGTVVTGDVRTLDASVIQQGGAEVMGDVRDLQLELLAIGAILGPAVLLLTMGFFLATIVAGWALAAVAHRQVRATEEIISREPVQAFLIGLAGLIVTPIVAVLLIVTIIGAPLGLGILLGVWPLAAFLGYLVTGIWIGDWVLHRSSGVARERPYLAATIGIIVLQLLGLIPPLAAIAGLFGFGAVIVFAWRAIRGRGLPADTAPTQAPAPMGV